MNTHLAAAVATVTKERGGEFKEAFAAASRLVAEFGESDLAELVANEVPASVPCEVVSDLLGILEWSTRDNGAAIRKQAEQWLVEGTSLRKIQIALGLEAYPFEQENRMETVLREVARAHPQVAAHCNSLIEQRRAPGQRVTPNPSIERTSPGKPGAASHVKR